MKTRTLKLDRDTTQTLLWMAAKEIAEHWPTTLPNDDKLQTVLTSMRADGLRIIRSIVAQCKTRADRKEILSVFRLPLKGILQSHGVKTA